MFLFVLIFVPLIKEQIEILSNLDYERILPFLMQPINRIETFMISRDLTDQQEGFLLEAIRNNITSLIRSGDSADIRSILNNVFTFAGSFSIGLIAVFFITFLVYTYNLCLQERMIVKEMD